MVLFLSFLTLLPLTTSNTYALIEENGCVPNVVEQFNNLNPQGNDLAVRVKGVVPGRAFTQAPLAMFGYQNHFQGIQRLHHKPYVLISGGDWWHRRGYLFVVKLGTKEGAGENPFGTNVSLDDTGGLTIFTTLLRPGKLYSVYEGDSANGPFNLIAANVKVDHYQYLTLNIQFYSKAKICSWVFIHFR